MPLNLALVGMPGSGKSTIGRQLARQLGWRFVDSDHEIERRIGGSIRAFFEQHGEPAFRDIEQQVVGELAMQGGCVLATGGGTVLRPANRQALRDGGAVVYLRSSPEDLFKRLRHDTQRPLLQVKDPLKRLRDLFAERDGLYREAAGFVIETGRPSVPQLVQLILAEMERGGLLTRPAVARTGPADPSGGPSGPQPGP